MLEKTWKDMTEVQPNCKQVEYEASVISIQPVKQSY